MKYKRQRKKVFAIIMVVAMLFSMSSVAFADTATTTGYSLTGFGQKVAGITITGADVVGHTLVVTDEVKGTGDNAETFHKYTYNIQLDKDTSPTAEVTATFQKTADAGDNCFISIYGTTVQPPQGAYIVMQTARNDYSVTLSSGVGTTSAYLTPSLTIDDSFAGYGKYDTYVFNYTISDSSKVVEDSGVTMQFGDPAYPATAPECYMSFTGSNGNYTAVYNGPEAGYYPELLSLYLTGSDNITATTDDASKVCFVTYDSNGAATEVSSISGNYGVVRIKAAGSIKINNTITLNFSDPATPAVPGGVTPTSVVSYLPIGQYATGSSWGDSTGKFTGGMASTGVSLGALGGYIEYYFEDGITNEANNPYGVDFVVYGNAFNGNPEAGAVQVSEDGTTWYELAGSMYYDGNFNYVGNQSTSSTKFSSAYTGTLNNATVTYTLGSSEIQAALSNSAVNAFSEAYFGPTGWYPSTSNYPKGSAHNNTGSNVTVDYTANQLKFTGITAIPDYDTTASYAFGYADVTPNGSPSTYGDAINPYTAYTTSKTGGDGFDLEWAVDISTKMPVSVDGKVFKYVRVYTAVLDNGTFGETSTEVCGIFTTANGQKDANGLAVSVGRTTAPTIKIESEDISAFEPTITTVGTTVIYDLNGNLDKNMSIDVSAVNGANVYINNIAGNSYTTTSGGAIRIIVQSGQQAPYIAIIK